MLNEAKNQLNWENEKKIENKEGGLQIKCSMDNYKIDEKLKKNKNNFF